MAIIVNTDSFRDRAPTGAELIAAERTRQIEQEGFSATRDDKYKPGTLSMAAVIYATVAGSSSEIRSDIRELAQQGVPPRFWPWPLEWWKPGRDDSNTSRIRELSKAGALIAAEIDRLQREGA